MKINNNNETIVYHPQKKPDTPARQNKTVRNYLQSKQESTEQVSRTDEADSTIIVPNGCKIVLKGETLYGISRDLGISISDIVALNNFEKDKNGNWRLREGDIIKVYSKPQGYEQPASNSPEEQVFGKWKIEHGSGAYSIMSKFNLEKEELQKLNPNINLDKIKTDDIFNVPGYKIKPNDTLESIAKAHDITSTMLLQLNPGLKKELKQDVIINVPKLAGQTLTEKPEKEPPEKTAETTSPILTHKIQHGDVLSKIAEKYHVSMASLIAKNNIQNPDKLPLNQELVIPNKDDIEKLETKQQKAPVKTAETSPPKTHPAEIPTGIKEETRNQILEGKISQNRGIVVHIVKNSDTLDKISKKYNIPIKDLIIYNHLSNITSTTKLSDKQIKHINIIATKKAVLDATGVSSEFINNLIAIEKKSNKLYSDACGNSTIGIGHNTNAHKDKKIYINKKISDNEIYSLLARDITLAQNSMKKALGDSYNNLRRQQKEALYGLIFNTGNFTEESSPRLISALKERRYADAACQIDHASGSVDGKQKIIPGLAKRRFMDISKFIEGSNLSKSDLRRVLSTVQKLYNAGLTSIKNENNIVDFNAFAKKSFGKYIDQGLIKIKE